jgi:hypothetical protein
VVSLFPSRAKQCCFIQILRKLTRGLNAKNRLLNHILGIAAFVALSRCIPNIKTSASSGARIRLFIHILISCPLRAGPLHAGRAHRRNRARALTAAGPKVRRQITPEPMRHLIGAVLPLPRTDRCCAATCGGGNRDLRP